MTHTMQLEFKDEFAPKYKGKLFKVTPAKLAYKIDVPVEPMTREGKALQKLVEKLWRKEMDHFRTQKEKEYTEAIKATERNIYKTLAKRAKHEKDVKKLEHWLDEEAKGANVMIKNAIKTLESLVGKKAREVYEKAAKAIDKEYKTKLTKMKVKAGLKIFTHVTLILVAGALGIAASVAGIVLTATTGGLGAASFLAIVPGVVAIGARILKSSAAIYKTVDRDWPKCSRCIQQLEKATKVLLKSVTYKRQAREDKDLAGKISLKQRFNLWKMDLKGDVESVKTALDACKAHSVGLSKQIELLAQQVTKLQEPIDKLLAAPNDKAKSKFKSKAQKLVTKQVQAIKKITKARRYLDLLVPTMLEGRKLVESTDLMEPGKVKKFLLKIQAFVKNDAVKVAVAEGQAVITDGAAFVKALSKF